VDDLLTTKQLQDLLQVDRITIYRMLNDGRLHGFKVGGQWRFSSREIEAWIEQQQGGPEPPAAVPPADHETSPALQALSLSCVEAIQGVCAEALNIATVTVEPNGTLLTGVSNSCHLCDLIRSTEEGLHRCQTAWRRVGNGQVHPCHAGLLCVSAPIEVKDQLVAVAAGCQFVVQAPDGEAVAWRQNLSILAADLGLDPAQVGAAAGGVRVVQIDDLPRLAHLIHRVADTFSQIGQERLNLLSRLHHIARVSQV